jgi:hypothetical protein
MSQNIIRPPRGSTKSSEQSVRQPPLRLVYPTPEPDRLDAITEEHPLYPIAAYVFHHCYDAAERRRLCLALLHSWPRTPGRSKALGGRAAVVATKYRASRADIAAGWSIKEDSARVRVQRAQASRPPRPTEPRIEIITGDAALARIGPEPTAIADVPRDPCSREEELAMILATVNDDERVDTLARLAITLDSSETVPRPADYFGEGIGGEPGVMALIFLDGQRVKVSASGVHQLAALIHQEEERRGVRVLVVAPDRIDDKLLIMDYLLEVLHTWYAEIDRDPTFFARLLQHDHPGRLIHGPPILEDGLTEPQRKVRAVLVRHAELGLSRPGPTYAEVAQEAGLDVETVADILASFHAA